ncbi:MAG: GGDEF domain-containing protein [Desulfuromonadaceae bacterium]
MSYTAIIIEPSLPLRTELMRIAQETGLFSAIYCSTDSGETKQLLQQYPIDLFLCGWDTESVQLRIEHLNVVSQNEEWADIPTMAFVQRHDPELRILAFENGMADCHDFTTSVREVAARMRLHIGLRQRTRKLLEEKNHLARIARTDNLTGIYNRAHFDEILEAELSRCRRTSHPVAVLLLDLDHFKSINDTYGHSCGAMVLQQVAQTIKQTTRCSDVVCRYGGEEFAIILPNTSLSNAHLTAEKIRQAIAQVRPLYGQQRLQVTATIGISGTRGLGRTSAKDLVREADLALYQGKENGRNRSVVYHVAPTTLKSLEYKTFPRAAVGYA